MENAKCKTQESREPAASQLHESSFTPFLYFSFCIRPVQIKLLNK
jgi:hypothetical protein